jgi:hypothetical protein
MKYQFNQTVYPVSKQSHVITENDLNEFLDTQDSNVNALSILCDLLNKNISISDLKKEIELTQSLKN